MDTEVNMPKPLSIFLKTATKLDDVAALVAKLLGHELVREERDVGPIYRTFLLCIEIGLVDDHGLEDDLDIPFSEFDLQLYVIALQSGMVHATFDAMYDGLAAFVSERLSAELSCPVMLVENLQRIRARW
jgi:hypothetical protein